MVTNLQIIETNLTLLLLVKPFILDRKRELYDQYRREKSLGDPQQGIEI